MTFRFYNYLFFFVGLSAFAQTTVTPYQSDKFVDSIGANVHFGNLGLPYTINGTQLTKAVCSIGIRHLRDGVGTSSTQINIHNALALCGVKTDYTLPTGSTSYATYNSTVNDVEAFEPPNEQTITTAAGAATYATYLTSTFPTLIPSGFPIYAPTFTGGLNLTMFAPGGTYYSATPNITIGAGGGGTGGSCSATLGASAFGGSKVASCSCSGGSGYTSAPPLTVVAQDSFGQGATVSTTVSGGALNSCTVQNLSAATSVWTVNNGHCYQAGFYPEISGWGGPDFQGNNYGSIPWCKDQNYVLTPSLTNYLTEAGYYTQFPIINGLPEANLAAYVPRLLLNNFSQGITRTYLYELYDDLQNTAALNVSNPLQGQQYTYGLLRNDLSWKPSAYAVANLINLLRDPGPSFTPTALTYTLSGTTTNVQSELFQKRDGTYYLALWIADSSFNVNSTPPAEIVVTPQAVTVAITSNDSIAQLYQMDAGGGFTVTPESGASVSFNVTDKVSFLQIVPNSFVAAVIGATNGAAAPLIGVSYGKAMLGRTYCPLCATSTGSAATRLTAYFETNKLSHLRMLNNETAGASSFMGYVASSPPGNVANNEYGNADITNFSNFACAIHTYNPNFLVSWGINYLNNTTSNAVAEAQYVWNLMGPSGTACSVVTQFEIGNEPENYGVSASTFATGWNTYATAIRAAISNAEFVAPSIGIIQNIPTYLPTFMTTNSSFLAGGGTLSQHYYREGTVSGATIANILLTTPDPNVITYAAQLEAQSAANSNLPIDINEGSTVANGGAAGVSNTAASAFYVVTNAYDWAQALAGAGPVSLDYTAGGGPLGGGTYTQGYSPYIDSSSITYPNPESMGLQLLQVIGSGVMRSCALAQSIVNLRCYQVGSKTILVNQSQTYGTNVTVTLPYSVSSASMIEMTTSSMSSTSEPTIQGSAMTSSGSFTPGAATPVTLTNSTSFTINCPLSTVCVVTAI